MSSCGLSNLFRYVHENAEYLEGYENVNSGVLHPEKYAHLFKKAECDTFEKTEEMKVFRSENYSAKKVTKGMPERIINGKFGKEMHDKIKNCMEEYYSGNKTEEEVKQFFKECCVAMRVYCTSNLQTTGYNEKDNRQIIGQIFEVFSKENQRAAGRANEKEGIAINQEYGGDQGDATRGFAYYNSQYYYECEAMRDILREMTLEMAREWGVPEIDTKEIEDNTIYTLDGSLDFNSGWNQKYRNTLGVGSMIDQNIAPPKDFKMFFNPSPKTGASEWNGILSVEGGDIRIEFEVPFYMNKYNGDDGNDIYNASELIKITLDDKKREKEINDFLKNFELFTYAYGARTGLSSVRGNYQRKLLLGNI